MRSAAFVVREGRNIVSDAAATAQTFARSVGSKGLKTAAEELRKARGDLPSQFADAFERAGGLARKGGDGLKRHYEFLLEAQELRARYAELLARAPILTEKGKQFLARLELEKRAEQLRDFFGRRRRLVAAEACDGDCVSDQGPAIRPGEDYAATEQAACGYGLRGGDGPRSG